MGYVLDPKLFPQVPRVGCLWMNGDDRLLHPIGIENWRVKMVDELPVGNQDTVIGAKVGPRSDNGVIFGHVTKKESLVVLARDVIDEVVSHKYRRTDQLNADDGRAG